MTTLPEKAWYVPEDAEFIDGAWRPVGTYQGETND
jgi:hypothetical protein